MSNYIHKKIDEANTSFSMFEESDNILVALSGGADSVALLLSLKEYYPALKLYACHVNHMLRGEEADRDMHFVQNLCQSNGIILETLKTDVASYAKKEGLSTELAARNVRYSFFKDVCKKYGINKVATAHTLSDNAETVLFNLTRGTGLQGLCGIPAVRKLNKNIILIRPLIFIKRSDVEEYLSSHSQEYVTDSSNLTDDYTRNYFRHNIIPLMKKVNPSFEESLGKTCSLLYKTQSFIDNKVNENITNDVSRLAMLDECLLSSVIMKLYNRATNQTLLEKIHIDDIIHAIKSKCVDSLQYECEICLPGKISAVIKKGFLDFVPTVRDKEKSIIEYYIIPQSGVNFIEGTDYAVSLSDNIPETPEGYFVYYSDVLNKNNISGRLYIRNRRTGDTIKHGGMTKKIKDILNHRKIPHDIRNALPFICDETGIICIPGICKNDDHKYTSIKEDNQLYIYIYARAT